MQLETVCKYEFRINSYFTSNRRFSKTNYLNKNNSTKKIVDGGNGKTTKKNSEIRIASTNKCICSLANEGAL